MKKIAVALVAVSMALAAAEAAAAPPGFSMGRGALRMEGQPVYSLPLGSDGKPLCSSPECLGATKPILAPPEAKADGLFTIFEATPGQRQWAYEGKPLYTYKSATASGQTDPFLAFLSSVPVKDALGEGLALKVDDPRVAKRPGPGRNFGELFTEYYPPASIRAQEQGSVGAILCVDADGRGFDVKIAKSSGFERLDDATLKSLPKARFVSGKDANGKSIAVCGYKIDVDWALAQEAPPPPQ